MTIEKEERNWLTGEKDHPRYVEEILLTKFSTLERCDHGAEQRQCETGHDAFWHGGIQMARSL
jgi:hypothetical protein